MSYEIPDGFYDFDEVVREARAKYTPEELARECESVSYTHLTLPTICSV